MTTHEFLIRMSDAGLGEHLGELAEHMLPEQCEFCPARECCDTDNTNEPCADVFARWMITEAPGSLYTNGKVLKSMSAHEMAIWIGDQICEQVAEAGCCDACPIHTLCSVWDAGSCAAAWEDQLAEEVGYDFDWC